jgi:hypothetical protein
MAPSADLLDDGDVNDDDDDDTFFCLLFRLLTELAPRNGCQYQIFLLHLTIVPVDDHTGFW